MENPKHSVLTPLTTPALEMSDNELFWQANWKKFLAVLLVVVALIFLSGGWMWWTTSVRNAAESLYSQASTPEDWRGVVEKFPGSVPAGNAQLRLAAALRGEDNLDGAVAELEKFQTEQSGHPLAGSAWLALGELRQMQGKAEEALEVYRQASLLRPESYATPLSMIAEAKLLVASDRDGEARAILESVGLSYSQTPSAMVAQAELEKLALPPADPVTE